MKTITMLEVYKSAWYEIARKYAHQEEINKNTIIKLGRENSIALHHMEKYQAQMQELHTLILEAEMKTTGILVK